MCGWYIKIPTAQVNAPLKHKKHTGGQCAVSDVLTYVFDLET